ncbi:hypothetical protein JKP88DRAFT_322917 [Tribonema minus]|uniref:Uncharacterized protein n=1 Tax=Tribonema minus TaxID=303371 RepID=A0A835YU61_9STRA|nr:hypothetical protein JKP88DRAFT_322917 [Tribonema minus]
MHEPSAASLQAFIAATAADTVVLDVVNEVVDAASAVFLEREVNALLVPYAAEACIEDVQRVLSWAFLQADTPLLTEPPDVGAEPPPVDIDSWARGHVPTRTLHKTDYESTLPMWSPDGTHAGSDESKSMRSLRSKRSRVAKKVSSPPNSAGASNAYDDLAGPPARTAVPTSPTIMELSSPAAFAGGGGFGHSASKQRVSEVEDRRRQEAERRAAHAAAERAAAQQLEKAIANLKGREWTLDGQGHLLEVKRPNPDSLPAVVPTLGVEVRDIGLDKTAPNKSLGSSLGRQSRKTRVAHGRKASSTTAPPAAVFFAEDPVAQPSLLLTVDLAPGVGLRQNDVVKEGPPPIVDPMHLSKQEFQLRTQRFSEQDSLAGSSIFGGADASLAFSPVSSVMVTPTRETEADAWRAGGKTGGQLLPVKSPIVGGSLAGGSAQSVGDSVATAGNAPRAPAATARPEGEGGETDAHWQLYTSAEFSNPPTGGKVTLACLPSKPANTGAGSSVGSSHRRRAGGPHRRYMSQPPLGRGGPHVPLALDDASVMSGMSVGSGRSKDNSLRAVKAGALPPISMAPTSGSASMGGVSMQSAASSQRDVQLRAKARAAGQGTVHKRKGNALIQALLLR